MIHNPFRELSQARMAGDQPHTIDVYQDLGFDVKFKWSKALT